MQKSSYSISNDQFGAGSEGASADAAEQTVRQNAGKIVSEAEPTNRSSQKF